MENSDVNLNQISNELIGSFVDKDASELVSTLGDTTIDELTDNKALEAVPILSILVKLAKGGNDVKNYLFTKKVLGFLIEAHKLPNKKTAKFIGKLSDSSKYSKKVGITIIEILDSFSRPEKAVILAKVFKAYLSEEAMTTEEFIKYAEIIDACYVADLDWLCQPRARSGDMDHLIAVGIVEALDLKTIYEEVNKGLGMAISLGSMTTSVSNPNHRLTKVGIELKRILSQY